MRVFPVLSAELVVLSEVIDPLVGVFVTVADVVSLVEVLDVMMTEIGVVFWM